MTHETTEDKRSPFEVQLDEVFELMRLDPAQKWHTAYLWRRYNAQIQAFNTGGNEEVYDTLQSQLRVSGLPFLAVAVMADQRAHFLQYPPLQESDADVVRGLNQAWQDFEQNSSVSSLLARTAVYENLGSINQMLSRLQDVRLYPFQKVNLMIMEDNVQLSRVAATIRRPYIRVGAFLSPLVLPKIAKA